MNGNCCRHGVTWCTRCGVYPWETPPPGTPRMNPPKFVQKPEVCCVNRSQQIGWVDCGCAGDARAYRCSVFVRPHKSPPEPAYCVKYLPVKRNKIMSLDQSKEIARLGYHDLVSCDKCDQFQQKEIDNG